MIEKDLIWNELELDRLLDNIKPLTDQYAPKQIQSSDSLIKRNKMLKNPSYGAVMNRYQSKPSNVKFIKSKKLDLLSDPIFGKLANLDKKYLSHPNFEKFDQIQDVQSSPLEKEFSQNHSPKNQSTFFLTEPDNESEQESSPKKKTISESNRISLNKQNSKNKFTHVLRNRIGESKKIEKLKNPILKQQGRSNLKTNQPRKNIFLSKNKSNISKVSHQSSFVKSRNSQFNLKKNKFRKENPPMSPASGSTRSTTNNRQKIRKNYKNIKSSGYGYKKPTLDSSNYSNMSKNSISSNNKSKLSSKQIRKKKIKVSSEDDTFLLKKEKSKGSLNYLAPITEETRKKQKETLKNKKLGSTSAPGLLSKRLNRMSLSDLSPPKLKPPKVGKNNRLSPLKQPPKKSQLPNIKGIKKSPVKKRIEEEVVLNPKEVHDTFVTNSILHMNNEENDDFNSKFSIGHKKINNFFQETSSDQNNVSPLHEGSNHLNGQNVHKQNILTSIQTLEKYEHKSHPIYSIASKSRKNTSLESQISFSKPDINSVLARHARNLNKYLESAENHLSEYKKIATKDFAMQQQTLD